MEEQADAIPDDTLILKYRAGDPQAFHALYHRYKTRLYSFCLTLLQNQSDADDALQEIFRYLVRRIQVYRPQGRFKSFIFQIAHSVSMDILRKRHRTMPLAEDYDVPTDPPAQQGPQEEELARLRACVARLPEPYREIMVLRLADETPYEEIAEILSLPLGTVKSRIHQAVILLRRLLAQESSYPGATPPVDDEG